jgi:anti-anti-sigma factor
MEIQRTHESDTLVLALAGRLDATWAEPVEAALDAAIRAGEHRIVMDFAGVDYISSAGLRVVIGGYKQLRAIQGCFAIRSAQPGVAKVIELSGLVALLAAPAPTVAAPVAARCFESPRAQWESHGALASVRLRAIGGVSAFDATGGEFVEFTAVRFGLGVAALAATRDDALPRLGEFLCVAGCAAHLPAGGANRPDFLVAEQAFVPGGWISSGLVAEGTPGLLLRFEARAECRAVPFAEIAATALEAAGTPVAAFVLVAETAGLVGASLRQSPSEVGADPFAFPAVRDRLKFTSERAFRDTTSLVVGIVARPGSPWDACLRPFAPDAPLGHAHAVVFPYRPIRKGAIALDETVRALFEAGGLQAVLHLLNDTREPEGSGDSEFHRGACWVAPVTE